VQIIAGIHKGRKIIAPHGARTRPTGARVRESLFSILGSRTEGAHVLDLFAGSGALGLEAVSRGAAKAVFVDNARGAVEAVNNNCRSLKIDVVEIVKRDVFAFLKGSNPTNGFDLIFADPPYNKNYPQEILRFISANGWLNPNGILVLEESSKAIIESKIWSMELKDRRNYGDTCLFFFGLQKEKCHESGLSG